jgi:DNA/RNA endonuclease YhcR with UshA esterase domain
MAVLAHGVTEDAQAAERVVTPIAQITTEYKGKFATVEGTIVAQRNFKSGMRFTLQDDGGRITLVLFDRELRQVPKRALLLDGAAVNATGRVDFFNDEAQIVPVRGTDVVLVAEAPKAEPVAINTVSDDDKDKLVTVQGTVAEVSNFAAGFKFALNDGTGRIDAVLFENVYDGLTHPEHINVGAVVRLTGRVDEFRGALELIPGSAGGVAVVSQPTREVPGYKLGAITGNDHNALVRVEGDVAAIEPFEDGVYVVVKDDSGAQRLRLYSVVAKRVGLGAGVVVSVVGRVKASRRGITIDVVLPSDIEAKK